VNNLAEGAGRFSKPDKSRFYTTAIGSATESAAMLDVCLRRQLVRVEDHERGKQLLERIVAMLVKLCRAMRDG
jgi:four helix bundle protein